MSAGGGIRFANIMNEFANLVEKLGPLGQGEGINENALKSKLKEVSKLITTKFSGKPVPPLLPEGERTIVRKSKEK